MVARFALPNFLRGETVIFLPRFLFTKWGVWSAWTLLLVGYGVLSMATIGYLNWDGPWFLQVSARVAAGEILYKDIFFGVTPLSMFALAIVVKLFGPHYLILCAYMSLIYAASALVAFLIADELGLGRGAAARLSLLMLAVSSPWVTGNSAPYGPLAALFAEGCLWITLKWFRQSALQKANIYLALAGLLAGMSFSAKQTLGVYAALAVGIILLATSLHQKKKFGSFFQYASIAAGGFTAAVFLALLPVALTGGLEKYIEYGFINKRTYLEFAGQGYFEEFNYALRRFLTTPSHLSLRLLMLHGSLFPPLLALPAWIAAIWVGIRRKSLSINGAIAGIFVGFAFLDVFPRASHNHTSFMLPLVWLIAEWSFASLMTCRTWITRLALKACESALLLAALGMTVIALRTFQNPLYIPSPYPHFKKILLLESPDLAQQRIDSFTTLKYFVKGENLYLSMPRASFFYLFSGISNPTPYDYPLITAFGLYGQESLIQRIESGEIPWVCLQPLPVEFVLRPAKLEDYVSQNMVKHSLPLTDCTLYHR